MDRRPIYDPETKRGIQLLETQRRKEAQNHGFIGRAWMGGRAIPGNSTSKFSTSNPFTIYTMIYLLLCTTMYDYRYGHTQVTSREFRKNNVDFSTWQTKEKLLSIEINVLSATSTIPTILLRLCGKSRSILTGSKSGSN